MCGRWANGASAMSVLWEHHGSTLLHVVRVSVIGNAAISLQEILILGVMSTNPSRFSKNVQMRQWRAAYPSASMSQAVATIPLRYLGEDVLADEALG